MSKENALQFLNTLPENERAMALLKGRKRPEDPEEVLKIYAETAAELGEQITAEDFRQALAEMEEQIKKATESAAAEVVRLDVDQLDDVAGGFYRYTMKPVCSGMDMVKVYNKCRFDYQDTSCWFQDACNSSHQRYYDCEGKYHTPGDGGQS